MNEWIFLIEALVSFALTSNEMSIARGHKQLSWAFFFKNPLLFFFPIFTHTNIWMHGHDWLSPSLYNTDRHTNTGRKYCKLLWATQAPTPFSLPSRPPALLGVAQGVTRPDGICNPSSVFWGLPWGLLSAGHAQNTSTGRHPDPTAELSQLHFYLELSLQIWKLLNLNSGCKENSF